VNDSMRDRLTEALKRSRADYAEVRFERTRSSRVSFRGRRLEVAAESVDAGGCVRVLCRGRGWGVASFTTLDDLPRMVEAAERMSRAVVLDEPIVLAPTEPRVDEVVPEIDGDPADVSLADKRRFLEQLNGLMLAAWNDGELLGGHTGLLGWGVSIDGGRTWVDGAGPPLGPNVIAWSSDPVVAVDERTGWFYLGGLAIGSGPSNAIAIARGYLAPAGLDVWCYPAFVDVDIDGTERTAIKLFVEPRIPPR
jgi:stage V sporulation protein SpoVS